MAQVAAADKDATLLQQEAFAQLAWAKDPRGSS